MARIDDQQLAIARVYAKALLDLARAQGEHRELLEELARFEDELDRQPDFESFLADPVGDESDRGELLEKVLRGRASDLLVNVLQVMNRKGRLGLMRALVRAYVEEYEELEGILEVSATTAVPLTEEARMRLGRALGRLTEKEVLLKEAVDDSLIGGMVLEIGDRKLDASVAKELGRFGNRLMARASVELAAQAEGKL